MIFKSNPKTKPKAAAEQVIKDAIMNGESWDEEEKVASSLDDEKTMRNIKSSVSKETHSCQHSFDALGKLKEYADKKEKYLLYKINRPSLRGGKSYVMKAAKSACLCKKKINVATQNVEIDDHVPWDIDGNVTYKMRQQNSKHWKSYTHSSAGFVGATCKGSHYCLNPTGMYITKKKETNFIFPRMRMITLIVNTGVRQQLTKPAQQ